MEGSNEISEDKKNKVAGVIITLLIAAVSLFYVISMVIDKPFPTGRSYCASVTKIEQNDKNKPKLTVKLENGDTVTINLNDPQRIQIGDIVSVKEMSSMRFSIKTYKLSSGKKGN